MNTVDNDLAEVSWHARVLDRCDAVLNGLADAMGNLRKPRRPVNPQSIRFRIFEESLNQSGSLRDCSEAIADRIHAQTGVMEGFSINP
jgi:hypothetical protein